MAARFFHRLGASRLDRTICSSPAARRWPPPTAASSACTSSTTRDSRLILIWGSNSITSNLHFWTFAQAAKRAGAKLIAIDPRRTETADKCHQHIALLPGHRWRARARTDARADRQRLARPRLPRAPRAAGRGGWPALRERALQWPPERTARVCGITPDEVRGLARDSAARGRRRFASTTACSACTAAAARCAWLRCCLASPEPGASAAVACCCRRRAGSPVRWTARRSSGRI